VLELAFTASALSDEPKNYHAWSHRYFHVRLSAPYGVPLLPQPVAALVIVLARQWAVSTFGLWDRELEYSAGPGHYSCPSLRHLSLTRARVCACIP
jgi:hypothetical protein